MREKVASRGAKRSCPGQATERERSAVVDADLCAVRSRAKTGGRVSSATRERATQNVIKSAVIIIAVGAGTACARGTSDVGAVAAKDFTTPLE